MTLIFTADDYGAYAEIDDGILAALDGGWLNSVAMLANGHDMKSSIKKILPFQQEKRVDVGCHFTMNSGKALSSLMQKNRDFTHKGHFRPYFNMNISSMLDKDRKAANMAALKAEIMAQIDFLMDREMEVKHLSSHFNTLHFYDDFFAAQCEVLAMPQYEHIKIRSINIKPKFSKYLLPALAGFSTLFSGEIDVETDVSSIHSHSKSENYLDALNKRILNYAKTNRVPKMPKELDGFHYQSVGSLGISKSTKRRKAINKSEKIVDKVFQAMGQDDNIEYIFHLADPIFMSGEGHEMSRRDFKNYLNNKYAGVTPKYMDNRHVEFQSLENFYKIADFELNPQPWSQI